MFTSDATRATARVALVSCAALPELDPDDRLLIDPLAAAGVTVYQAYLDRLTTVPGIAASAVTLLLVVLVSRARGATVRVWLDHGVLHIDEGDSHRRFDLSTPTTKVEMVGRPGTRRWKVLFLRKGMGPYEVDAGMVHPVPFVEAISPYRPRLTSGVE